MTTTAPITLQKLAWHRDPSIPQGQRALGTFECPCGHVIPGVEYAGEGNHACTCGMIYDGRGNVITRASDALEARADERAAHGDAREMLELRHRAAEMRERGC